MIRALLILMMLLMAATVDARQVAVKGSRTKAGTYRAPYVRSAPDRSRRNNYGTKGMLNPATGKPGTQSPRKR